MNLLTTALTGHYETMGNVADADYALGLSFGARKPSEGLGTANAGLAAFILGLDQELPIIAQQEIADVLEGFRDLGFKNELERIEGKPSTATGGELDSWAVLERAQEIMPGKRALLVAQANHIGRVGVQAKKQGMNFVIPAHLPRTFDPFSSQPWTRGPLLWAVHEAAGIPLLWKRGKI